MTYSVDEIGEETHLLSFKESTKKSTAKTGSSWWSSALILANVVLGVGLLNFPAAFKDAGGIPAAMTIQTLCVIFIVLGLISNAHCADICGKDSLHAVVNHYCGTVALAVCNIFVFIHNFGACVTLLVIIADQIDRTMSVVFGVTFCQQWFLNRSFTLTLCSAIFILPACFPKRIDSFAFGSIVGISTTFYVIGLVLWKYLHNTEPVHVQTRPAHWVDMFKVLPTICFSYEGHIEAVPLYACMQKRNIKEFTKTALAATLICVTIYTSVGLFGYLGCGIDVKSDILTSYHPVDAAIVVGMVFAALKAITSYPIIFFCARIVCEDTWQWHGKSGKESKKRKFWTESRSRNCLTVVLFLATLLSALYVPTMGSVIALLGGSSALFIFIFPGLCIMQAYVKPRNNTEKCALIFAVLFVVLGVFIATTTTMQSVQRYINGEFSEYDVTCTND